MEHPKNKQPLSENELDFVCNVTLNKELFKQSPKQETILYILENIHLSEANNFEPSDT